MIQNRQKVQIFRFPRSLFSLLLQDLKNNLPWCFLRKKPLLFRNMRAGVFCFRVTRLLRHLRALKQHDVCVSLWPPGFCMFSFLMFPHAASQDYANHRSITIFKLFQYFAIPSKIMLFATCCMHLSLMYSWKNDSSMSKMWKNPRPTGGGISRPESCANLGHRIQGGLSEK